MKDWKEIYKGLDPKKPLEAGDSKLEEHLYTNDFFKSVKKSLVLNKETNSKLLLSGHTGCGKSTFLNLLSADQDMKDNFHIVKYSLRDILDTNDIDYIDLLLSIAVKTISSFPDETISKKESLKKKVDDFAKRLQGILEEESSSESSRKGEIGAETSAGIGGIWPFDFLKAKIFFRYKLEENTRAKIREYYRVKITDFIDLINSIIMELELTLGSGKRILIIIDDTDKIPPDKGLSLFLDNGHHLASPTANILFVIDISLATSDKYPIIRGKFNGEEFFPAIKILERDGGSSAETKKNRNIMNELVTKRIPPDFFDEAAVNKAIEYAGGVVRELIRILNYGIFMAEGRIRIDHIESARYKIANEFNLNGKHTKILNNILNDPDWLSRDEGVQDQETLMDLLHMPALFQYRNGSIKWYRPYPIFTEYLQRLYPDKPKVVKSE